MHTLTTTAAAGDTDVQAAAVIIIVALVGLTWWFLSEFDLHRPTNQELIEADRDALAVSAGVLPESQPATSEDLRRFSERSAYDAEFADAVEKALRGGES